MFQLDLWIKAQVLFYSITNPISPHENNSRIKKQKKRPFSKVSYKLLYIYMCIFSDSINLLKYAISSFNRCFLKFQNVARDGNCPSINPYKSATPVTAIETELIMRQGKYSENS